MVSRLMLDFLVYFCDKLRVTAGDFHKDKELDTFGACVAFAGLASLRVVLFGGAAS